MQKLKFWLFILVLLLAQFLWMPRLSLLGIYPDLIFIMVIMFLALRGEWPAGLVAIGFGLLQDFQVSNNFLHVLLLLLMVLVGGWLRHNLVGDEAGAALLLVIILSPLYVLLFWCTRALFFGASFAFFPMLGAALIFCLWNIAASALLYPWFTRWSEEALLGS